MRPLVFVLVAGCAGGAMKQATIVGQCAGDDAACSRKHPQAPLAIGTRFYPDVSAAIDGTTTPNLRLESAVPEIVAVTEDGALVGKQAGSSAVLITTDDGSVVDFIHVWVSPITRLTLARRDGDRIGAGISLAVGEDVTLEPTLWFGAQRLSGDADITWTATDDKVISVMRDGSTNRRRLRARAPGKSTVTVALGDAQTTVAFEVLP